LLWVGEEELERDGRYASLPVQELRAEWHNPIRELGTDGKVQPL
jgi:hypothetical protein